MINLLLLVTVAFTVYIVSAMSARDVEDRVNTDRLSLTLHDGVVTSFTDKRTGETFAVPADRLSASLTGLRRLQERHLWNDKATLRTETQKEGMTISATWRESDGASQLDTSLSPQAGGDVLITQKARSASRGLVGVQWGMVVPDGWDVLVPGHSGLRFGADSSYGSHQFDYPLSWEAQFVLLQGKRGGLLIFAEDNAERFKVLHLEHQRGRFLIGFETRCTAPFEPLTETTSVRWRVHAYEGSWLVGAGVYRQWAERTFDLAKIRAAQPTWVKDVQFVVITDLDAEKLKSLARSVEPRQTLLYVPDWRRDGYDRNYPDYTARTGFAEQMKQARAMGFRIMLHVNYFGCTPENPAYKEMQPFHTRDPFTKALLYWDWQRATPPIKFAYVNPAAKAWRQLFVRKMVALCQQLQPDALHLDQTLCIYNDANGLMDGMNMMQGNLALHRELRDALPHVALSGEGLNEVSFRYEAFAQRHIYGLNFHDAEWNDRLLAQAHPVSSSLLTSCTTMYGYLGMTNPQMEDYYFAMRSAYERFGVVPTLAFPSREQLQSPSPLVKSLLNEARWFQQNRPQPDYAPNWSGDTLFAYRTADGKRAEYRRDATGVTLAVSQPSGWQVISRRVTGVTSLTLPGRIDGWRAYDETRLLGLNPKRSYLYVDEPRDMNAFHVHSLPDTATVRRIGIRAEFAVLSFDDRAATIADLREFSGALRSGETLRDGTVRQADGFFQSATGTSVQPQGEGIFAHPPWKAKTPGYAWLEFDVQLPPDAPARFETGVGLTSEQAARESDGVTFRVIARPHNTQYAIRNTEKHSKSVHPEPLTLDLSSLRGQKITLRLETHPGETVNFDWALWTRPRVVLTQPRQGQVEVVSPQQILSVVSPAGETKWDRKPDNRYILTLPFPGSAFLLFSRPHPVKPPTDLRTLPFSTGLVFGEGHETPPRDFMRGIPATATVQGVTKEGFSAHPPQRGQTHVDFLLTLPNEPLQLTGFAGIRDGAEGKCQGVGFRVEVNGEKVWSADIKPGRDWTPFNVSLAPFAGRTVVLTFITDSLGGYDYDWAHWGELKIVSPAPRG